MQESGAVPKQQPNFLIPRAQIIDEKQKFLNLIEKILKNSREDR